MKKVFLALKNNEIVAYSLKALEILEYCNGRKDKLELNMMAITDKERMNWVITNCEKVLVTSIGSIPDTLDVQGNSDLYEMATEEYDKLLFLIKDLKNVEDNYAIGEEDKKVLKKARKLLKQLSKPDNFKVAIGFDKTEAISRQGDASVFRKLTT